MPLTNERHLYRRLRRWAASGASWLLRGQQNQFYFLGALIGLISGASAVAFHGSISWAEDNIIYRFARLDSPWKFPLVILTPALGGLIAGWVLARFAPQARGSGIPQTKAAYYMRFGRIRFQTGFWKFILGTLTIGTGGSLGREGPTVQIAASFSSFVGRWLGLAPREVARLIPMASAGGIAAAFNTPLAAIMFAIEEIMGDLKHRALAGIVLVAVIAAVMEHTLLGSHATFSVPSHEEFSVLELGWSVIVGLQAGVTSEAFVATLLHVRQRGLAIRSRWKWALPALGGLGTGITGAVVLFACGRAGVFGIGYADLTDALFGNIGLWVLLALLAGKFIATISSYSSGGAGGIFAPTLFLGAMLGGAVGALATVISPEAEFFASSLAVIGMGAMFAGIIRAPVTSILMIFELTRDYALILPIMLANLIAYTVAGRLRHIPIYEALLLQDGVNLRRFPIMRPSENWKELPVNTIMTHEAIALQIDEPLPEANTEIAHRTFCLFPVLDTSGRYHGMVHRKGIERVAVTHPERNVGDVLVDPPVPVVHPDEPIREIVRRFVRTEHTTLPVISRVDPGRLLGVVTLHDITRQQFRQEDRAT
ncbi:MAG TPA: chloride channel protein [Opitutaceae bacterium]